MNPLVFAKENVVMLEIMTKEAKLEVLIKKAKNEKVREDFFWSELEEDLRYLTENTRLIIDILKKRNKKESP